MYPDFQQLIERLFNIEAPSFLSNIKTFGFFVAIAFLIAAWVLNRELKRKEDLGQLKPQILPHSKGKKYLSRRQRESNPGFENVRVYPHQRTGELVILALLSGLVGAKIFNALETWDDLINDPIGNLFSGGGLTFYGGLIVASVVIFFYCKKHRINFIHLCDAIAPALMIAYAIGRLGCHFSGDGDWGIFNSAYISLPDGALKLASTNEFQQIVSSNTSYFTAFGSVNNLPHAYLAAPEEVPTWLYAMNFSHNVINEGILIDGCNGQYCSMLPVAVFPTSLYEAFVCGLLSLLIWRLRKRFHYALHLFGFYLILNGLERFFIEKIKVNYKYDWGFVHPAQSEIISVLLFIFGLLIFKFYRKDKFSSKPDDTPVVK